MGSCTSPCPCPCVRAAVEWSGAHHISGAVSGGRLFPLRSGWMDGWMERLMGSGHVGWPGRRAGCPPRAMHMLARSLSRSIVEGKPYDHAHAHARHMCRPLPNAGVCAHPPLFSAWAPATTQAAHPSKGLRCPCGAIPRYTLPMHACMRLTWRSSSSSRLDAYCKHACMAARLCRSGAIGPLLLKPPPSPRGPFSHHGTHLGSGKHGMIGRKTCP